MVRLPVTFCNRICAVKRVGKLTNDLRQFFSELSNMLTAVVDRSARFFGFKLNDRHCGLLRDRSPYLAKSRKSPVFFAS